MKGSAVAGSDYESVSSSLMFPAGSINGSTQCINITILDGEVFEAEENLTVTLTVMTPRVMVENAQTAITIFDDEGYITISLPTMVNVTEGDGTVEVCATISLASDVRINITLATSDSSPGTYMRNYFGIPNFTRTLVSAVATEDYTPISSMLEFPVGTNASDTQCMNITVLDNDMFATENKTFTVELTVTPLSHVSAGNNELTITIIDDDSKSKQYMTNEGSRVHSS